MYVCQGILTIINLYNAKRLARVFVLDKPFGPRIKKSTNFAFVSRENMATFEQQIRSMPSSSSKQDCFKICGGVSSIDATRWLDLGFLAKNEYLSVL